MVPVLLGKLKQILERHLDRRPLARLHQYVAPVHLDVDVNAGGVRCGGGVRAPPAIAGGRGDEQRFELVDQLLAGANLPQRNRPILNK